MPINKPIKNPLILVYTSSFNTHVYNNNGNTKDKKKRFLLTDIPKKSRV